MYTQQTKLLLSTQKKDLQNGTATSKNNESLVQLGFVTQRIWIPAPTTNNLRFHLFSSGLFRVEERRRGVRFLAVSCLAEIGLFMGKSVFAIFVYVCVCVLTRLTWGPP